MSEPDSTVLDRLKRAAVPAAGVAIFAAALFVLRQALHEHHYADIARAIRSIPPVCVLAAVGLTALNYLVLSTFDLLALRHLGRKLSPSRVLFTSFNSYAVSHNLGFAALTGGSVRYRMYSAAGLAAVEITEIVAFCGLTFWLGFLLLGGLAFLLVPPALPPGLPLSHAMLRPLGAALLVGLAAYLAAAALWRGRPFAVRGHEFRAPSLRIAAGQVGLSASDWALAAAVLYGLLPRTAEGPGFPLVLAVFLVAQLAGMASQVPGGLGVFETVALFLLSPHLPKDQILASLVAFRLVYYVAPLFAATLLLGGYEIAERREGVARLAGAIGRAVGAILPQVLALATLVSGAILLFSGATPAVHGRLRFLGALLPLPLIEASHFGASLVGAALVVLAQGIQRKLDAAWHLTVALLGAGIAMSLLKGFDYEEAAILAVLLAAMIPSRGHFRRKASLGAERFTPRWIASIVLVAAGAVWLALFAHKHLELSGEAWWHYSLLGRGEGSRSLRATVGAVAALSLFGLYTLLKPARPRGASAGPADRSAVRKIVEASPSTLARLALLGDKAFLLSESGRAFLMYGVSGRAWVAMGDPVGPEDEWGELAWQFRERSDLHHGWTVFYQASTAALPLCLDLGLALVKIGEEARVPLPGFSLSGTANKHLRNVVNRFPKEGYDFVVVPAEDVPRHLPDLRPVSDAWLSSKHTREKRFSLGRFDEAYLALQPIALVRRDGRPLAFANLLLGAGQEEVSVDLMRHRPDAPPGIMDYVFLELMLWGAAQGYRWFNLGMAPLSGLENRSLAPLWSRTGAFLFRHGEHFYNFQGIRAFKEKFHPRWEPRYLASPGGLALPRVVAAVAALTSGGLKGVVAR